MLRMKIHFNELMYKSFRCPKLNLWNSSGAFFAGIPFHEKKILPWFWNSLRKKREKIEKKIRPRPARFEVFLTETWEQDYVKAMMTSMQKTMKSMKNWKYNWSNQRVVRESFSIYFTVHNFPSIFLLYTDGKIIGYLMTRITTCDICDARSLLVDTTLFFQRIWLDLGYYLHTLYCKHVIQSPILTTKGVMTMRRRLVIT